MIGIYKFTNKITGQSYIGQSIDIRRRYHQHKNRYDEFGNKEAPLEDTYFHSMLRHYGFHNFEFEILEECNKCDLDEREMHYIAIYNSLYPNGYNKTCGGNQPHTNKLSSLSDIDKIINLLQSSNLSNTEIGKVFNISDQMISEINTGRCWHKDNISYPIRKRFRKKYFCSLCGIETFENTKTGLCHDCYILKKRSHIPERDELYSLLSNNSFASVARMFNVSSNSIKRWCKIRGIPKYSKDYIMAHNAP